MMFPLKPSIYQYQPPSPMSVSKSMVLRTFRVANIGIVGGPIHQQLCRQVRLPCTYAISHCMLSKVNKKERHVSNTHQSFLCKGWWCNESCAKLDDGTICHWVITCIHLAIAYVIWSVLTNICLVSLSGCGSDSLSMVRLFVRFFSSFLFMKIEHWWIRTTIPS